MLTNLLHTFSQTLKRKSSEYYKCLSLLPNPAYHAARSCLEGICASWDLSQNCLIFRLAHPWLTQMNGQMLGILIWKEKRKLHGVLLPYRCRSWLIFSFQSWQNSKVCVWACRWWIVFHSTTLSHRCYYVTEKCSDNSATKGVTSQEWLNSAFKHKSFLS